MYSLTTPGEGVKVVSSARCLYTSTASKDFVLDRVGPVVVGGGFSGHGFTFAPAVGEVLADLADGDARPSIASRCDTRPAGRMPGRDEGLALGVRMPQGVAAVRVAALT